MILYLPDPLELLENSKTNELINIKLPSGGSMNAEPLDFGQLRIIEIISTDPMDYMDSKYQPGTVIKLRLEDIL
jgi:hypothetical protein